MSAEVQTFSTRVSVLVPAAPQAVYRAFITPELVMKWLGGEGVRPVEVDLDIQVGGHYLVKVAILDEVFEVSGRYQDVIDSRLLVYTHVWHDPLKIETLVRVDFLEREDGTEVVISHSHFPNRAQADAQRNSWQNALESLVRRFEDNTL